jgi:hypothetical protein
MDTQTTKFNSFCITIRPKNGISCGGPLEKAIIAKCKKYDYAYAVAEMEDEARHIHIQIWIEKESEKGTIARAWERLQEKFDPEWSPAAKKVLRGGIRIAYDDNFYQKYLDKGGTLLFEKIPVKREKYYPNHDWQQTQIEKANSVDKKFHRWKCEFEAWLEENQPKKCMTEISKELVAIFMADMMFESKKWVVITSAKARKENCDSLHAYIVGSKYKSASMFLEDDINPHEPYQNWTVERIEKIEESTKKYQSTK